MAKDYPPVPKSKAAKRKIETTMKEFKKGTLRSSSGEKVTDRDQAIAIALSKAREKAQKKGKMGN